MNKNEFLFLFVKAPIYFFLNGVQRSVYCNTMNTLEIFTFVCLVDLLGRLYCADSFFLFL